MRQKIAAVYETDEYNLFKLLEGNRNIKHTNKIIKSIKEIGLLMSPILVNDRYEIIDGQGTFMACKALGLPVRYVIQNGIGVKEAQYLNRFQTNWGPDDFIHSYSVGSEARESYMNLTAVMNQFAEYDKTTVIRAAGKSGLRKYNTDELKTGNFKMNFDDMNRAIRRLTKLRMFNDVMKGMKYIKNWQAAVIYVIALNEERPEISIEQLREGIKVNAGTCDMAKTMKIAIGNIDFCYNNRRRIENRFNINRQYEDDITKIHRENQIKGTEARRMKDANKC